jgi:hypothetical protein
MLIFQFSDIQIQTNLQNRYSNLEHLREVAKNLCSSEDHDDINKLCERELAALINKFYQVEAYFMFYICKIYKSLMTQFTL